MTRYPPCPLCVHGTAVHTMQVFRPLSAVHTRPQLPLWSYARTPRPHVPAIRSTLPSTVPGRRPTTRCIAPLPALTSPPLAQISSIFGRCGSKGTELSSDGSASHDHERLKARGLRRAVTTHGVEYARVYGVLLVVVDSLFPVVVILDV